MTIKVGIDLGSTAIKVVFLENEQMVWKKVEPTVPGQGQIANDLIAEGLAENRICTGSTGRSGGDRLRKKPSSWCRKGHR